MGGEGGGRWAVGWRAHVHTVIWSRPTRPARRQRSVAAMSSDRTVMIRDSIRRPASKLRLTSMLKMACPSLLLRYRTPCDSE